MTQSSEVVPVVQSSDLGDFSAAHYRVANRLAAMQAGALASIRDRFYTPSQRPPDTMDWDAVLQEVHDTASNPVARAELNARLAQVMPELFQQAQQAAEEQ